ncbi:lysosomal alpha-mannosidase-like, partial [Hyposmocoma kahamanoa]|uniref:lysosomal alpha-mannosidase-like n=1 Tax=Hyposmocoma kahamanoa TaxID=1477025 RepID=UPI000E6D6782
KLNNTFSECGRPLVAWQSDCYGHSREFTSLAAQMGFDGLFINPISFEDELARMRRMGLEFIWRGSDDLGSSSDIYTHKLFDGYWSPPGFCFSTQCTDPLLTLHDDDIKNVDGRVIKFINSMLNRQSPNYNTSHVMVIMGKVFAYYDATMWFSNIDQLIDSVNEMSYRLGKKVRLYYSTPACYLKAVYQSNSRFETKQDDFFPIAYDYQTYLTGFFTTHPSLKLLIREALVFLQISKQLQVFANLKNNDKIFEEFGWIFSLMQDHSIVSGALRKHVKSYYVQKIFMGIQKSTNVLKQAFNKLRESPKSMTLYRCLFNISSCENLNGNNAFIVIYNPLSWSVTMPVRLPVQKSGVYSVYDAH